MTKDITEALLTQVQSSQSEKIHVLVQRDALARGQRSVWFWGPVSTLLELWCLVEKSWQVLWAGKRGPSLVSMASHLACPWLRWCSGDCGWKGDVLQLLTPQSQSPFLGLIRVCGSLRGWLSWCCVWKVWAHLHMCIAQMQTWHGGLPRIVKFSKWLLKSFLGSEMSAL